MLSWSTLRCQNEFLAPRALFKRSDIQSGDNDVNSTKFEFTEVNSLSDRASSLYVSAELTVSILSGAFSVGGSGAYTSNKQGTSESTTVATIARYRTASKSLDLNLLAHAVPGAVPVPGVVLVSLS